MLQAYIRSKLVGLVKSSICKDTRATVVATIYKPSFWQTNAIHKLHCTAFGVKADSLIEKIVAVEQCPVFREQRCGPLCRRPGQTRHGRMSRALVCIVGKRLREISPRDAYHNANVISSRRAELKTMNPLEHCSPVDCVHPAATPASWLEKKWEVEEQVQKTVCQGLVEQRANL